MMLKQKCWGKRTSHPSRGCFAISSFCRKAQKQKEIDNLSEESNEIYTVDVEAEEVSNDVVMSEKFTFLPEDLVERILAMVPFPQVCKARVLSKAWQARFSPSRSHVGDKDGKLLATSFQKQVRERSINWTPPCPIFLERTINWRHLSPIFIDPSTPRLFYAYELTSRSWPKMPSLSFLPWAVLHHLVPKYYFYECRRSRSGLIVLNKDDDGDTSHVKCLQLEDNALLLVATVSEEDSQHPQIEEDIPLKLHVANILTQTWRRLPQAPWVGKYVAFVKLVTQPALDKYKVIIFYFGTGCCFAQCYDSKSNSWRKTTAIRVFDMTVFHGSNVGLSTPAHLDGVLYMKIGYGWKSVLAFNVEEETFKVLQFGGVNNGRSHRINLVGCGGNLLMIAQNRHSQMSVEVLKLDLRLRRVFKVVEGPPAAHLRRRSSVLSTECVSDGVSNLCFRVLRQRKGTTELRSDATLVYNMHSLAWRYLPMSRASWLYSSVQANCNPFLAV